MENNNNIFDDFIDKKENNANANANNNVNRNANNTVQFVDEQTGVVEEAKVNNQMFKDTKKVAKEQGAVVKKDISTQMAERALIKIDDLVKATGETFSGRERVIASDLMVASVQAIRQSKYQLAQIDFLGNNIEGQLKRWAKLGVGKDDYLYPELRQNGKTGMVDIRIKPQYQTLEKLIVKYCSKKIIKFKTEVICKNDVFETEFDWTTGQEKVVKFEKGEDRNPNDLTDIVGAFKVAFIQEPNGNISQLITQIDQNRIMRAYNSATTKNVWNADTQKMVLKTVTWEMWNGETIRPFMVFPDEVIKENNIGIVNENSDVDFSNKDLKHKDIIDAETSVKESVGTGDVVDF